MKLLFDFRDSKGNILRTRLIQSKLVRNLNLIEMLAKSNTRWYKVDA
jgi:hypothetical protein